METTNNSQIELIKAIELQNRHVNSLSLYLESEKVKLSKMREDLAVLQKMDIPRDFVYTPRIYEPLRF
jgi:hypothetical protein